MTIPLPNLDDKTFAQLMDEARALIPRHTREWTDFNPSDPGITFLELFAWINESLIYRQNQITDETKWRLLEMLTPARGTAAVDVEFLNGNEVEGTLMISAGDRISTVTESGEVFFEAAEDLELTTTGGGTVKARFYNVKPDLTLSSPEGSFTLKQKTTAFRNQLVPIEPSEEEAPDVNLGLCPLIFHPDLYDTAIANLYILHPPSLTLDDGTGPETWIFRPDLLNSGSDSPHFTFDYHRRSLVFGDNVRGMIPKKGSTIVIHDLLVSDGFKANVRQGRTWEAVGWTPNAFFEIQSNPVKATGGRDWYTGSTGAEQLEEAVRDSLDFHRSPFNEVSQEDEKRLSYFINQYRAVTKSDYENHGLKAFAPDIPEKGVLRAWAVENYNLDTGEDEKNHLTVLLIPQALADETPPFAGIPEPEEVETSPVMASPEPEEPVNVPAMIEATAGFLEERRQITTRLHVGLPELVLLDLHIRLKLIDELAPDRDLVRITIKQVVQDYFDPVKGFGPTNADGVRLSEEDTRVFFPETNNPDNTGKGRRPGRNFLESEVFTLLENLSFVDFVDRVDHTLTRAGSPEAVTELHRHEIITMDRSVEVANEFTYPKVDFI